MTSSKNIAPSAPQFSADTNARFKTVNPPGASSFVLSPNPSIANVIDRPREAEYVREMVTWKTPHLGYVQMYVNPSSIIIAEAKDFTTTRTKSGFIIQYGGEKLTQISISGTTGSSGIEGINVLEQVYRAEQFAFEPVANALERQVSAAELVGMLGVSGLGMFATGNSGVDNLLGSLTSQFAANTILDMFQQPFPTLASLAASIEMFFQGVSYRGFFTTFSVTESAEHPGIFEYSMNFTAYARQGTRRNFMPWHKQPYTPADSNNKSNYSFYLSKSSKGAVRNQETSTPPRSDESDGTAETSPEPRGKNKPNANNAIGQKGKNMIFLDLRTIEE